MQRPSGHATPANQIARAFRSQGFSLVELMVTIAVAAILLAIATPSFTSIINSNRLSSAANEMVATLQTARMEAVRRNTTVQVCGSNDQTTCDGGNVAWIALVADGDGNGVADDAEVLRVSAFHPAVQASIGTGDLAFRADGFARDAGDPDGVLLNTSFRFCIPTTQPTENVRVVSIGSGSRISTDSKDGGGTCT